MMTSSQGYSHCVHAHICMCYSTLFFTLIIKIFFFLIIKFSAAHAAQDLPNSQTNKQNHSLTLANPLTNLYETLGMGETQQK